MRSMNRVSFIAIYRFLASLVIVLSTLTRVANAQNPVPLINQPVVPDAIAPGSAGFSFTVNGTGFASGAIVNWNGSARATTFVSRSRLTATILASDITTAHTASVTVVNRAPGGGSSNVIFFEVTPASPSIALGAPSAFGAGSSPYSVAVGDFNGDGKLDLAVANNGSNNVSVLLGNGDGTFGAAVNYGVGGGPVSVAVGDFNGDGKLDLAVGNLGSNNVSVLLGNGDGTFQPAVNYGAASCSSSVAVGDFNGDGKLDLAVANECSNNVSVLLGNGDGTFQAHVDYAAGAGPDSVALGDFNGDGKLDLAVANPGTSNISVLLGNGDGTFGAAVNYGAGTGGPQSVAVGDFNGDGKLDLAVANTSGDKVGLLLGNGDGTFQAAVDYGAGSRPEAVAVGDFNDDGRLDLAVADGSSASVSVLLQVPTVALSPTSLNFPDQVVGTSSAPQTVTLNASVLALNISSIAVTGTNATDFSQTNTCGSGLAAGASCTINVTFKPTQVGPRTASVTINDNAAGSPQSVSLSGTGVVSGTNATLSATSLTFATQVVGTTSSAQSVTLSDYGTMALSITSIVVSGDFSQTNACGSSLAAGASCTINLAFRPTQSGTRTGAVSIMDNAPGTPQKVGLNGTGTVVQFNPTSLSFHCQNQPNTCPPPPQTTTLTNTGGTTLSISSITITGSTTFSQTNNCGSSVVARGSCTIAVTFKSSSRGTFSGAVSVSDNGGGSPQQVLLSATETKRGAGALAVRSAMAAHITASVPAPTGPMHVGTRIMDLADSRRDDPLLADGTKRELLVRYWYPASLDQGCEPAEYTSPKVWNYFSELTELPLPQVTTNSCLDARVADGAHPVVIFTHGYTGTFSDYTFLFEDLASRGYVVASVDHTYEATAVEFPDGRLVKSLVGSHLANSWRTDDRSLSFALSVRLDDLRFVFNELERLNTSFDNQFAGKLDLKKVALAGHSLGGLTTWNGVQQDTRFKAGVLLDPYLANASLSPTETPVMMLAMGNEQRSEEECRLWGSLRGPRFSVNLRGAEHLTPSDAVWLARGTIKSGSMGADKTIAAVRDYIAAFLDANLRGRPMDPLLTGPSAEYPDADVTTQNQLLRSKP